MSRGNAEETVTKKSKVNLHLSRRELSTKKGEKGESGCEHKLDRLARGQSRKKAGVPWGDNPRKDEVFQKRGGDQHFL